MSFLYCSGKHNHAFLERDIINITFERRLGESARKRRVYLIVVQRRLPEIWMVAQRQRGGKVW